MDRRSVGETLPSRSVLKISIKNYAANMNVENTILQESSDFGKLCETKF